MAIALVVAHADVASGRELARAIEREAEDIEVLGVVAGVEDATGSAAELLPDVVLLHLNRLPRPTSVIAGIRLSAPSVRILAVSADERLAYPAICAGATNVLGPEVPIAGIVTAVHDCASGSVLLPARVVEEAARDLERFRPGLLTLERQILERIAAGCTPGAISSQLEIAEATVWRRVADIRAKLELLGRLAAATGTVSEPATG